MGRLKEIYNYRQMIYGLVKKDLRGRYRGSFLGFLWTFLNPLLQLAVYTLVFSVILENDIDKYYLFLFVALIPWLFFSSSVTAGAGCIVAQQSLVTKIYFPREVLPISHVTTCFVNMLYSFIVVFAVIVVDGNGISLQAVACLPIIMLVEYTLTLGITMIVSACTVYFRDLEYFLGIIVMAWQFLTPIMYSVEKVPEEYLPIFNLNPMTPIIVAYRDILYYCRLPDLSTLLTSFAMGVGFLIFGFYIFGRLQRGFAEEL